MSTYYQYETIFDTLARDLSPEERKRQWWEQVSQTSSPMDRVYQLIAALCTGYSPTTFSPHEQEERRQRSEQVREAVWDILVQQEAAHDLECWQTCLIFPYDTEQAQRFNEHVTALFPPKSEEELEQYVETLIKEGMTPEQAEQAVQTEMDESSIRRGELLVEAVTHYAQMTPEQIRQMTDPSLSSNEQLVQNLKALHHATTLMSELNTLMSDPCISLTDRQREHLLAAKDRQLEFTHAQECLSNIANPYYQYLDLDNLRELDADRFLATNPDPILFSFVDDIDTLQFAQEASANRELERFGIYEYQAKITRSSFKPTQDNDLDYDAEILDIFNNDLNLDDTESREEQEINQDKAFEIAEQPAKMRELLHGEVLAFEKGDDACILYADRARGSTRVISDRPGRLFDQSLTKDISALSAQLEDADPTLLISSREFKDMKKALKAFSQFGALGDRPSPYQREKMEKELKKLQESTEKYLSTKGQTGKNEREQKRMDAANAIKNFAARKLKHLGLVEKSQNTLTLEQKREKQAWTGQREGESVAQARERQREENMQRREQQKDVEAQRKNDPYGWLEQQCASYPEEFASLKDAFRQGIDRLRTAEQAYQQGKAPESIGNYKKTIGTMMLMELLQQERQNTPEGQTGPLARWHQDTNPNKVDLAQELGKKVVDTAFPSSSPFHQLAYSDVRKLMETTDVHKLSGSLLETAQNQVIEYEKQEQQRKAQEQEKAIRNAPPVKDLVLQQTMQSAILSGLKPQLFMNDMAGGFFDSKRFDELCEQGENGLAHMVGTEMLRDMIVFDMAVQERIGRGKNSASGPVETMLFDAKGLQQLQNAVENSKEFAELTTENLNKVRMRELLTGQAPRKVARQMLQNVKNAERQAATNAPSVSKQREQNAPVRQSQAPQSRQPIVPLK